MRALVRDPQAGVIALQAIRGSRPVAAGQRVLINGAGGGAGSFAVQLAKAAGGRGGRGGPRQQAPAAALVRPNADDLATVTGLVADGELRCVIDRTYPLRQAAAALRAVAAGEARGKVVVSLADG